MIYKKLLEFQKLGITIKKGSVNPHFKNRFADMNEVLDKVTAPLNKLGVVVVQVPQIDGLHTILMDTEDETSVEGVLEFVQKSDAQKVGSNITYNRRYSLVTMLGLEDEDDDAESAIGRKVTNEEKDIDFN